MVHDPSREDDLVRRAVEGDRAARAALFNEYRPRLLRVVRFRLDRRLSGRFEPEDVLQEVFIDLTRELTRRPERPDVPAFLWLRTLTHQRISRLHREQLGVAMRDAGRVVPLTPKPEVSSVLLADEFVAQLTTPSQAAQKAESRAILHEALDGMEPIDREVIAMRHFEGLSNKEAALVLDLSKAAASNRYLRAMARLQQALTRVPGLIDPR